MLQMANIYQPNGDDIYHLLWQTFQIPPKLQLTKSNLRVHTQSLHILCM